MLVVALVLGMTVVGCDTGTTNVSPTNGKKTTLVCLGDSATAGYNGTTRADNKSQSYPAYLQKKADNISVINAGVGGDTTEMALARVDSDVLSKNPDIVIILLGGNDFKGRFKGLSNETIIETAKSNLQKIINKIDNGNRKIYLANFFTDEMTKVTIPPGTLIEVPGGTTIETSQDDIDKYKNMYSVLAASSSNITLIEDVWTGIWGVHMSDALHPDAQGYEIMADNIYKVVQPYLETLK